MVYVRKIFRDLCHFQNFGCIIFLGLVREVVVARGPAYHAAAVGTAHTCLLHAQRSHWLMHPEGASLQAHLCRKTDKKFWLVRPGRGQARG